MCPVNYRDVEKCVRWWSSVDDFVVGRIALDGDLVPVRAQSARLILPVDRPLGPGGDAGRTTSVPDAHLDVGRLGGVVVLTVTLAEGVGAMQRAHNLAVDDPREAVRAPVKLVGVETFRDRSARNEM